MQVAHDAVTGAGPTLRAAGTAQVRFDVTITSSSGANSVHWAGTTRARYAEPPIAETEFSTFEVRLPNLKPGPLIGRSATVDRQVELRTVTVGETRYHRSAVLKTGDSKPWVRLAPQQYQFYGDELANPDSGLIDPQFYLRLLEGASASEAFIGDTERTETVDGEPTRLYRISCTENSEVCLSGNLGPSLSRLFPGEHSSQLAVWVDGDGVPRKLEMTADLDTGRSVGFSGDVTESYQLRATLTLSQIGAKVEVTEPPAAEVTEGPVAVVPDN